MGLALSDLLVTHTLLWLLFIKSTNPINMNPQRNCKETLFGATIFQKINELHLNIYNHYQTDIEM